MEENGRPPMVVSGGGSSEDVMRGGRGGAWSGDRRAGVMGSARGRWTYLLNRAFSEIPPNSGETILERNRTFERWRQTSLAKTRIVGDGLPTSPKRHISWRKKQRSRGGGESKTDTS
uniref:Uncharacterized protein n=1 Tax=Vitis vinifera TaxID=29760 RepID=A5BV04_VITVI|nr:hypothetical protein VITISV_015093 [Vitis vinifera]